MASLLDLKVKTLISLGRYQVAKDALFILEGLELSQEIIKNLGEYSEKIENGIEREKIIIKEKIEQEKIEEASRIELKRKAFEMVNSYGYGKVKENGNIGVLWILMGILLFQLSIGVFTQL